MAEEHDVDQRGQLPEEDLSFQAEDHGGAVEVGGADGHGDEGHHADVVVLHLAEEALQEGVAAIEVDQGGEQEEEIDRAGKLQLESEKILDERGESEDGDGYYE